MTYEEAAKEARQRYPTGTFILQFAENPMQNVMSERESEKLEAGGWDIIDDYSHLEIHPTEGLVEAGFFTNHLTLIPLLSAVWVDKETIIKNKECVRIIERLTAQLKENYKLTDQNESEKQNVDCSNAS